MKSPFLLILALILFIVELRADLGSSLIYSGRFHLKNGQTFDGHIEASGYDEETYLDSTGTNQFCSSNGMLKLLKLLQRKGYHATTLYGVLKSTNQLGKVVVFKKLHLLSPRPLHKNNDQNTPVYGLITERDYMVLDSSQVQKIEFKSAIRNKRYWQTSKIEIITEGLIDTVKNLKYWNRIVVIPDEENCDSIAFKAGTEILETVKGYVLFNYNSSINLEELKRLAHLKLRSCGKLMEYGRKHPNFKKGDFERELKYNFLLEKQKQEVAKWFHRKGIVLIRINGTC